MSVDFETALVTAIIDSKDIRTIIRQKITADFFFQTQPKAAYIFLLKWFNNPNYGDVPSWESFADAFTGFEPLRVDDSLVALADKLREQKLYSDISTLIQEIAAETGQDAGTGFDTLKKRVAAMTAAHTVDNACDVRNKLDDLRAEYFEMKSGATGLKGHPYPWDALNQATLGLQDQQLVIIYGRPKAGKTWALLEIARNLHAHGMRPIIFSQELSDIEVCRRFVALSTNVNYDDYLRGTLDERTEAEFLDNMDAFAEQQPVIVDMLTERGTACLTEIDTKVDEYGANVVLIDGLYFLGDDWKELAKITRGLKTLAKTKRIPILGTTQANRSRGKKGEHTDGADDFAYGDSFGQDCDLALRITADIENRKRREAVLFTAAIREGKQTLFTINMRLASDMTQKSVQTFGDDLESDDLAEVDQHSMNGVSDVLEEASIQ